MLKERKQVLKSLLFINPYVQSNNMKRHPHEFMQTKKKAQLQITNGDHLGRVPLSQKEMYKRMYTHTHTHIYLTNPYFSTF